MELLIFEGARRKSPHKIIAVQLWGTGSNRKLGRKNTPCRTVRILFIYVFVYFIYWFASGGGGGGGGGGSGYRMPNSRSSMIISIQVSLTQCAGIV